MNNFYLVHKAAVFELPTGAHKMLLGPPDSRWPWQAVRARMVQASAHPALLHHAKVSGLSTSRHTVTESAFFPSLGIRGIFK